MKVDIDNHLRYSDEEYKLHLMVRSIPKVVRRLTQLTPKMVNRELFVRILLFCLCRPSLSGASIPALIKLSCVSISTHVITLNIVGKDAAWTKLETDHLV